MTNSANRPNGSSKPAFKVVFYAYAGHGTEASGGDKICVEFCRGLKAAGYPVTIYTTAAGEKLCRSNGLEDIEYGRMEVPQDKIPFPLIYLYKAIRGMIYALMLRFSESNAIFYSASDFLPDSLPALIMKRRSELSRWIAGFYLFAPNFFEARTDLAYGGGKAEFSLKNLFYYISQRIAYHLMLRHADYVFVANELDKRVFVGAGFPANRVEAIYGGVDVGTIQRTPAGVQTYDGCFVGRLHPQKGPMELIRIWSIVCKAKPHARLAIIGSGPLEAEVKYAIERLGLQNEVDMLGWIDGERKYEILKSSSVFLHTPVRDTGGMAAAEGMACGLPVVGFDLPGYEYAYPRGMLKAPVGDEDAFAGLVLELLRNRKLYEQMKSEALDYSQKWDWNVKSFEILNAMLVLSL